MKFILLCGFALAITSCAEMATTYHPGGDISGGYGDLKLKPDTHMVYFDGNSFVTQARAKKYFLRRASTLTLQSGHNCFVVKELRQTLNENYKTKMPEAVGTKYYYKDESELIDTQANLMDQNSYSGIIQSFPEGSEPKECYNAKTTLQMSRTE